MLPMSLPSKCDRECDLRNSRDCQQRGPEGRPDLQRPTFRDAGGRLPPVTKNAVVQLQEGYVRKEKTTLEYRP